jgi:hypothetical protein
MLVYNFLPYEVMFRSAWRFISLSPDNWLKQDNPVSVTAWQFRSDSFCRLGNKLQMLLKAVSVIRGQQLISNSVKVDWVAHKLLIPVLPTSQLRNKRLWSLRSPIFKADTSYKLVRARECNVVSLCGCIIPSTRKHTPYRQFEFD